MAKYTDKKKSSTSQQEIPVSKTFKSIKKKNKMENGKMAQNYVKNFTDVNGNKNRIFKTEDAAVSIKSKKIVKAEGDEIFSSLWLKYKPRSTLHVASGSDWVAQLIEEEKLDKPIALHIRQKYKELAEKIFNDDVQAYELLKEKRNQNQNGLYHKKVLSHGTTKDRIAAFSVQCMDSPVYSISDLFSLIEFISPRCKVNCKEAVDNILHLLKDTLLPKHYVAKEFECHNFLALKPLLKTNPEQVERQLVLWYFESQIRLAYLKVVENLEKLSHDSNTKLKSVGIRGMQNLLLAHPDQDAETILRKLVNKLGDTNKQVAGDVLNVLTNIQLARPQLKIVLISLVEEMLYRPNISFKSQYYGLCFLKDIVITRGDAALVEKLIKLYFEFFQSSSKAGEVDSRFMGAILRGLNRAFPFFEGRDIPSVEAQIGTLYKLCHMVGFNVATQALQLIYQVQSSITEETCDRFYSLLYAKLLEPCFGASSANGAFLNLVFKAMVRDPCCARVRAFVRRMLQICKYHPPHMLCATLFLVSEAVKDNESFADLNDLFLTADNPEDDPEGELDEEDDLEYYPDIDTDEEAGKGDRSNGLSDLSVSPVQCLSPASPQGEKKSPAKAFVKTESSWLHRDNWGNPKDKDKKGLLRTTAYDPSKRNPLYSGAELSPVWELRELANHYHPTVSLFATNLLNAVPISYAGDPLQDFTLMRFLNRFTQRNPKKVSLVKNKLSTIMGSHAQYKPIGARNIPVGSKDFKKQQKGNVAAEDLFLYNYFTKYVKTPDEPSKRQSRNDDEDVSDDEFDEYLQNMKGFRDSGMAPAGDDDDEDFDFANSAQYAEGLDMDSDVEDEDEDNDNDYEDIEDNDDEIEGGIMSDEEVEGGETDDDEEADDEEEDIDDDESLSEEEEEDMRPAAKKRNVKRWKPSGEGGWRGMLADADEFSSLLEGNADAADPLAGTSEAVFNRDKSHAKQLKWEKKRDEYLQKSSQGFTGRPGRSSGSRSGRPDRSTSRPRRSNFKASRGGRKGRK